MLQADGPSGDENSPAALINVTKTFGGIAAVRDVSFALRAGEVLALLGENGAGKSTCVKLLAGVIEPDAGGSVLSDGRRVRFRSPLDAQEHGIAVMHQHPGLFPDLSVAENIFLGRMPRHGPLIDARGMETATAELLASVGLSCAPSTLVGRLRISEQQLVEVARALSQEARVLIMDEPTAALSQREVDRLFSLVEVLRSRGTAMMFVGHRMDEIFQIADRITVLRDGRLIATEPAAAMTRDRAVSLMIGRTLSTLYPELNNTPGAVLLEVEGLSRGQTFRDMSFHVRAGEILGFGGLVGSGRTEIARVLFGIDKADSGVIRLSGHELHLRSAAEAMRHGIAYVSEDRLGQSLVMDTAILFNASLAVADKTTRGGLMSRVRELALVRPHLDRLRLRFASYDQPVRALSGGNQQKVVLSKWLATEPKILILDEPTQGIDVGSKAEVHAMIAALAQSGMAIILISSELPELLGMSDRILVMREGSFAAELNRAEASQEAVLRAATGPVSAVTHGDAGESASHAKLTASWWRRREAGLVVAIAAVVLPVAAINPRMLSPANLLSISMDAALLAVVAVAQMLVMVTRGIDLSVASVIGLSAYGAASLMQAEPGLGVGAGIGIASGLGLICGLINGLVITRGAVPAIVVTLGTLSVYRGIVSIWAGGRQISADQVPASWLDLTSLNILGMPAVVLIAVVVMLAAGLVLTRTPIGRELFAIGSNPDAAALIGIRVRRRRLGAFAVAGLLAGFDGALWASRYATVDARVATGFELTVVAAVVVGGVAIRGGSGSVLGIALGALLLLVIRNGLTLVRIDPLWLQGVYGLVIVVAVTIDTFVARRAAGASR
ncbi:ATP-binding cassette domain-containing protein [Acidisoma sp. L85]|jgi:rhamnose transport system ATP-binding protein|uniref:ATP-binding cassette domain-containing protein n=1 Tax=Acidisoma sp. L85 TaxID=1641850 RepID=UPI00131C4E3B|nr:ATP-binding cassette domain-containing protein [Acidisoma sp. L85]